MSGGGELVRSKVSSSHHGTTIASRAIKSESDLYHSASFKSYENITHTNYVQMVNSMINGAISEVADPEYVEYVKRHIQGLFENFAPVLMKSKSNEEMAMASPSRDKIAELVNQSIPKSLSLDFKLLEENGRDEDGMDFSKFGLGIDDENPTTLLAPAPVSNLLPNNELTYSNASALLINDDDDGEDEMNHSFIVNDFNPPSSSIGIVYKFFIM